MDGVKRDGLGAHPRHVIFLTCDAFGVLPPVSALTPAQAMYHFLCGYTARIPGTEVGVTEPQAVFSPCFGAPFLVRSPTVYAEMLADRLRRHEARAWLVNTGWSGGAYGTGQRIPLAQTRALIDAIHGGALEQTAYTTEPHFGLSIPQSCPGVPDPLLDPRRTWADGAAYDEAARDLVDRFERHFAGFADDVPEAVRAAAPGHAAPG
jgi:phosphoenolpyruvate carboxykinase (ATP)